jgi:methionyl-tRNA formyltransferase
MIPSEVRVVFIGTPDFSVPSLYSILESGYNVVGVITAPDRKSGRGLKVVYSPVKQFALENDIPVFQPSNLKSESFLNDLGELKADIQVVIAFRMLPEKVWDMPPMGTINLHASLLPQYRGAAPINRAIMNGETVTGVTTFKLLHAIDTGNLLLQKEVPIELDETAGTLHDKLMIAGSKLIIDTLDGLISNTISEKKQVFSENQKLAPKIFKNDCEIDWNARGEDIVNLIRGLSPYPTARFELKNKILKVFTAIFEKGFQGLPAGSIDTDGKTFFKVSCVDGQILLKDLQLEGKRRMSIEEFLRGYTMS